MSLAGFNDIAREGSGVYGRAARIGMPEDVFKSASPGGWGEGMLDTVVSRTVDKDIGKGADPDRNGPRQGVQLQSAWNKAKDFQDETAKLRAGAATVSSGPGARQARTEIDNKGAAVKDMKAAIAQVKADQKNAGPQGPAANGGGIGGAVKNITLSSVAGAVAETIIPGSSAAIAVAAMGAGTFGAKGKSEFSSPADAKGGGYQSSAGFETADVMKKNGVPAVTGVDVDKMMAKGPGFGPVSMNQIEFGVEPSLKDQDVRMDEEGLKALEADVAGMDADVKLGGAMYARWENTNIVGVDASEIGDTPLADLRLDENDAARLTSDNPALQEKPLTINPMKLA